MKVVIMAGGRGTRISSINPEIPKPMIPVLGKPILEYEIEVLRNQNYTDIILVIGYLGAVIKNHFGNGKDYGVHIEYIEESGPLGTAGALYLLKDQLVSENLESSFLLLNGDIIFDIDIKRFICAHENHGGVATLFTHPNNHPYDSGIIITDSQKRITGWLHKEDKRTWYKNRVNAGLHLISKDIFSDRYGLFQKLENLDLDRDILKPLIATGSLYAYDSPEYVKDMGTPQRLRSVIEDIKTGKVKARNLNNKQKAIFLDRDGTLNKYVGFLTDIDNFELLPKAADAIKLINQSDYLAIVVTNQPVVARGEVSFNELNDIHCKMETILGESGAYLDAVYFCPHHPHKGYPGEIAELKADCNCRKPKPGLLIEAAKEYNIDLTDSWMVGDSVTDILTGMAAHCKSAYLGQSCVSGTLEFPDLLECIKYILSKEVKA